MAHYSIKHSHGQTESDIGTYEAAVERVRSVYGSDCEIGHDGDISEGGEKTLVWRDAKAAEDDDGSRAVCAIRAVYEHPETDEDWGPQNRAPRTGQLVGSVEVAS